jgi:hypothetical protein
MKYDEQKEIDALYEMPVHTTRHVTIIPGPTNGPTMSWMITRVPTGWIYTDMAPGSVASSNVFVPIATYQNQSI